MHDLGLVEGIASILCDLNRIAVVGLGVLPCKLERLIL